MLGEAYDLGTFGSAEIGSSIGIAYAPEHAASSDQLLLVADRALYISKKAKLGVPALFDHELEDIGGGTVAEVPQVRRRSLADDARGSDDLRLLANDLAEALRDGSLYLHYQPIYESASGLPIALEALARWNVPDRGAHLAAGIRPRGGAVRIDRTADGMGAIERLPGGVALEACSFKSASTYRR